MKNRGTMLKGRKKKVNEGGKKEMKGNVRVQVCSKWGKRGVSRLKSQKNNMMHESIYMILNMTYSELHLNFKLNDLKH